MQLGFHPPLSRLYVFIRNEGNHLWYWLQDGEKRYIQYTAITGILKGLEIKESNTSFGEEMKADFEILADRPYVLRSGIESAFTKGVLMIINALSDDQLKKPVTLELKAGEKNNVLVSGRDPQSFEFIKTGSWENVNWELLMESAIARLGSSHPQPPSPPQPQPQTITQKQYQDLLDVAKRNGYNTAGFGELIGKYGFCRGGEISQKAYPQIWAEACDRSTAQKMNERAESELIRY